MAYPDPTSGLKALLARQVVALFNDVERGERPVARRADGLFGPRSIAWRVHGDVVGMMAGGIAGLLLQMLHPAVLAGVWDHSKFRSDMHGRLRRTARFISQTTYGGRDEALAAIGRVRAIHERVTGVLPDGAPYRANDPGSLAWVHATETTSFLAGYVRYAEPGMRAADKDRYVAEMAVIAEGLGADPVPRSLLGMRRLIEAMRPQLRADERTHEVAQLVLARRAANPLVAPVQALTVEAGIDLLPDWAIGLHGLPPPASRTLLRAGARAAAGTLRWAFR